MRFTKAERRIAERFSGNTDSLVAPSICIAAVLACFLVLPAQGAPAAEAAEREDPLATAPGTLQSGTAVTGREAAEVQLPYWQLATTAITGLKEPGLFVAENESELGRLWRLSHRRLHMHQDTHSAAPAMPAVDFSREVVVFIAFGHQFVRADSNLSHPADRILSRGWKPTFRWSAVHKCRWLPGSSASLSMSLTVRGKTRRA